MRTPDGSKSEVITAKWKTAPDSREEKFGMIALDDELELRFPMLDSSDEIPQGTTVLWGITDRLRRCTALTLPFRAHGISATETERLFFTRSAIRYLLVGGRYITEPRSHFVGEIAFTPQPHKELKKPPFGPAHAVGDTLFETAVQPLEGTVSARTWGHSVSFCLRFLNPLGLQAALDEANKLCVFLSFLAHQCVDPTEFHVWAIGEEEPYLVHC